jgi:ubiquinone/menaquinone biosynthesis C-methylase UbiE
MCDGQYPDIIDLISDTIKIPRTQPWRGLVLGCGDMVGEHSMFINPELPFAEVDAYDVSPKSVERARQLTDEKGLKVNYYVADVNQVELPHNRYTLVVIFQSFHHFEQIDHVARQINQALLPGGVFYTSDYIGPCKLQFTDRQLSYAQTMLQLLPTRYRRELDGKVRQRIQRVPPDVLSPDEAICSDQILPAMVQHMDVIWRYNWAGLLYPLLEGIAFNFTTSSEDLSFLKFLFNLDYALCQAGEVEPNFTITLATKR